MRKCYRSVTERDASQFGLSIHQVFSLTWTHFYTPDGRDGLRAADIVQLSGSGNPHGLIFRSVVLSKSLNALQIARHDSMHFGLISRFEAHQTHHKKCEHPNISLCNVSHIFYCCLLSTYLHQPNQISAKFLAHTDFLFYECVGIRVFSKRESKKMKVSPSESEIALFLA